MKIGLDCVYRISQSSVILSILGLLRCVIRKSHVFFLHVSTFLRILRNGVFCVSDKHVECKSKNAIQLQSTKYCTAQTENNENNTSTTTARHEV